MRLILKCILFLLILGCKTETKDKASLNAESIVNQSIEVSGGDKFNSTTIKFIFRDVIYNAIRNNGKFELSRLQLKDNKSVFDYISNDGYKRIIDGLPVMVEDTMSSKYSASINSVHYFSVLPYGLNDKAVNKSLLGEEQIKEKDYYKIKVTFDEDEGGEDFEDVFIYWIHKQSFKVDYLAYSYNEDDGIGMRFRAAYNERYINGLRFVNYNNYKSDLLKTELENLGKQFEKDQLELVSKIELDDIEVH